MVYSHLSVWISSKLESQHGKSHSPICLGNKLRGPQVSLAVQHTAANINDNNME